MPFPPTLDWIGDCSLRIQLGDAISDECTAGVRKACELVRASGIAGLLDITPAYTTLLLRFDPLVLDHIAAEEEAARVLDRAGLAGAPAARLVEIPVCYDPVFAMDLADVAGRCSLTVDQTISLHTSAEYRVAFVGFAPGFPYLIGLPSELRVPRLDSPRPHVPAGSVAIAGDQAGIYPHATPGGWRILGRTPLRLFDATANPASLLGMGDRVRFLPISLVEFNAV